MIFSQQMWECAFFALCLFREARGQYHDVDILRAIAWSIRNRVTKGGWFGNSWSAVLAKKFQYSSLTDPGDANLIVWPNEEMSPEDVAAWHTCMDVACEVYNGGGVDVSGGATHYFSQDNLPIWASKLQYVKDVGPFHLYEQT